MAIQTVKAFLNGTWHTLSYNSSTGKYEATVTAPNVTSWHQPGHTYAMQISATNTAATTTTIGTDDPTFGAVLKLRVKETVKPTITITSPGAGAYVTNNKQPIVFQIRDESGGSGINLSSLALKIDGGSAIGSGASGMVCTQVTNGYDCTYTPQAALTDGSHTVTIVVEDNDGNTSSTASRTYTVDTSPPVLNVTAPSNGFVTSNSSIIVQGATNDMHSSPVTVIITVNGSQYSATVDGSGNFSKSVNLQEGNNTIVVRATDTAGKYTEVTITGVCDTSVPVISSVTITPNPVNTGGSVIITVVVSG